MLTVFFGDWPFFVVPSVFSNGYLHEHSTSIYDFRLSLWYLFISNIFPYLRAEVRIVYVDIARSICLRFENQIK
jgi:hypothetical protein